MNTILQSRAYTALETAANELVEAIELCEGQELSTKDIEDDVNAVFDTMDLKGYRLVRRGPREI